MAETAKTLINDILQEIFVSAEEQSIQAPDFNTALRYLNRYMQQLNADGISIGWTNLVNPTDVATVPDGAVLGIIYNTALQLANSYDVDVSPLLVSNARDSMKTLQSLGITVGQSNYPSTLSIGSGNESDYSTSDHFYSDCGEDLNSCGDGC